MRCCFRRRRVEAPQRRLTSLQRSLQRRRKKEVQKQKSISAHLYRHGPQVRTEEEEPHELVGIYGNQVADLGNSQLSHGHVGRAHAHDLVVDFCLEEEEEMAGREHLHDQAAHSLSILGFMEGGQ